MCRVVWDPFEKSTRVVYQEFWAWLMSCREMRRAEQQQGVMSASSRPRSFEPSGVIEIMTSAYRRGLTNSQHSGSRFLVPDSWFESPGSRFLM